MNGRDNHVDQHDQRNSDSHLQIEKSMLSDFTSIAHQLTSDISETEMINILVDLQQRLNFFDHTCQELVYQLLKKEFLFISDDLFSAYRCFFNKLLCCDTSYLKCYLRSVVKSFTPKLLPEGISEYGVKQIERIQTLLNDTYASIPLSPIELMTVIEEEVPYVGKSVQIHAAFFKNLLRITLKLPAHREHLLAIIIRQLLKMDAQISRDSLSLHKDSHSDMFMGEVFTMELKEPKNHATAIERITRMDQLMCIMFDYVNCICRPDNELNWDATKLLYRQFLNLFDKLILPVHNCLFVQFLMFYLVHFKSSLYEGFVDYLWKKAQNVNLNIYYRQTSAAHLASFISRARYIPTSFIMNLLDLLANWLHSYLNNSSNPSQELSLHLPFFSIAQAFFYIIIFRHREIVSSKIGLEKFEGWQLQTLISCRFNPLRVCAPDLTVIFSAITRTHELALCETVLEKNRRQRLQVEASGMQQLEATFPYEPFLLEKSRQFIDPLYNDFHPLKCKDYALPEKFDALMHPDEELTKSEDNLYEMAFEINSGPHPADDLILNYGLSPHS